MSTREQIERPLDWLDDRLTISHGTRKMLNKIFPDHWSFMLGEIALYSFVILVLTGIFLTLYFIPSGGDVVYHGVYKPLDGTHMSQAYESTVNLSFSVRFGLVMRQMHHWAANVFIGSIVVHMCRIFFTGAFRRPRELNWIVGVTLLILAIVNGFLGYSLPDDLVSGTGLRIAFSILLAVPVVGTYLAFWVFGGNYPGTDIIPRFFILHVLLVPLAIIGLIGAHLGMMIHQKHTQFPGKGARENNVVGSVFWPTYAFKTLGFFLLTAAVLGIMAAVLQINPIWQYGPYMPFHVSYAVQPDWYMGWLDGALRVMPSWEIVFSNHMIPNAFFPGILLPGITFNVIIIWPFIEARFTKEAQHSHHLLQRPRDHPVRTTIGTTVLAFYFVLFCASATDVLANFFGVSLNVVLWFFRFAIFVVPILVAPITYRICLELQTWDDLGAKKRPTIIMRTSDGGYEALPGYARPGDVLHHLPPIAVPEEDLVLAATDGDEPEDGVRRAPRGPQRLFPRGGTLENLMPRRFRS